MINFANPYLYQPSSSSQISMIVLSKDQQFFHTNLDHKLSHILQSHNPVTQGGEKSSAFQRLYFEFCNFPVVELALNFFGFSGGFWKAARKGGGKVATWWRPLAMAGGGTVKIFKKCAPNGWWHQIQSPPHSCFKKCVPNDWLQRPISLSQASLGRVYIYMGKREFVSIDGVIEPIKGVVHIQVLHIACSL